jgi:tetratricopeptide (TPR) repeat protein
MPQTRSAPSPALPQAAQLLRASRTDEAEQVLSPLLAREPGHAGALHLMALIRLKEERLEEAAGLMTLSLTAEPRQPQGHRILAKILALLDRPAEAVEALRAAIAQMPDMTDAHFELGNRLHELQRLDDAEAAYRRLLFHAPRHAPGKLALGAVLIEAGRAAEAERLLTQALNETDDNALRAALHDNLALAQRNQRKHGAALKNFTLLRALEKDPTRADFSRAETFTEMKRFDEALDVYQEILARDPSHVAAHEALNHLLYCMGRDVPFLAADDGALQTAPLRHARAAFLAKAGRHGEALTLYQDLLRENERDKQAASGAASALAALGRHAQAQSLFERARAEHPRDANLAVNMAGMLLRKGDPAHAAAIAECALALEPDHQVALALLGTAWQLMGDERAYSLHGYDRLIETFDLEPPPGFASMESFNTELCAYLDEVHPHTREYVNQSLRGGTQTPGRIFGVGHRLVDLLAGPISKAVSRFVAGMPEDAGHPFLRRRRSGFAYADSWSSRLGDCGYHTNHVHPGGWISSCYYAGVPAAVADTRTQAGWLKFGEPDFEPGPKPQKTVQPRAGMLVLFPSYLWHGTIPFRAPSLRTTIAFDAVPDVRLPMG